MVAINRSGHANTMRKMLNNVKNKLDQGSSIIIFPEGTRKIPREKPDYKSGFVGIYNIANRKLLPIALNSGLCWPKHPNIIKKGKEYVILNRYGEQNKFIASIRSGQKEGTYIYTCVDKDTKENIKAEAKIIKNNLIQMEYDSPERELNEKYHQTVFL